MKFAKLILLVCIGAVAVTEAVYSTDRDEGALFPDEKPQADHGHLRRRTGKKDDIFFRPPGQSIGDDEKYFPGNQGNGNGNDNGRAPGRIIVQFKPKSTETEKTNSRNKVKATKWKRIAPKTDRNTEVLTVPDNGPDDIDIKIRELNKDPNVEFAEPDYIQKALQVPNDPLYSQLWGMMASTAVNAGGSNAVGAWNLGYTGSPDVVVGVIDEGIQYNHPDLEDNMWINLGETPNDDRDNDGNDYVDDIYGWNFFDGNNEVYTSGNDNHGE